MKRVMLTAFIVAGTLHLMLVAQEADRAAESEAPETFEEALDAAHTEYIANLRTALGLAVSEDELDEAVHIRRAISMEQLRADVTNTNWTWNRPNDPNTIHFRVGRSVTTGKGATGTWEVLENRLVIVKFGEDLFLFQFNEATTSYTIKAYSPARTLFRNGRRTSAR